MYKNHSFFIENIERSRYCIDNAKVSELAFFHKTDLRQANAKSFFIQQLLIVK